MSYVDVLEIFVERQQYGRENWSAGYGMSVYASLDPKGDANRAYQALRPRRQYRTAWQADAARQDIARRLKAGERPKKWGKRWREEADRLGIARS